MLGNKAKNLAWLQLQGFKVPDFIVIDPCKFVANFKVLSEIRYQDFIARREHSFESFFSNIIWIDDSISALLSKHESDYQSVSFRVSATSEDADLASYAGIYDSFLNVTLTKENFKKYFALCWHSNFSDKLWHYLQGNALLSDHIPYDFNIIIQKMFNASVSGIAFINWPLQNSKYVLTKGLGENIVNNAESESYDLENLEVPELIGELNLETEFKDLKSALVSIVKLKQTPQDIEWSLQAGSYAILQTRPITRFHNIPKFDEIILDATNISESYPGVSLPLTFSFIQYAYGQVYRNFLGLISVNQKIIASQADVFDNLLAYHSGHVYYQIENWYRLIALMPGYRFNKIFFEAMLNPQKNLFHKKDRTIFTLVQDFKTAIIFSFRLISFCRSKRSFLKYFNESYESITQKSLDKLSPLEILKNYQNIESEMLKEWRVPILNDFRLMIYYGILKNISMRCLGPDYQAFINEALSQATLTNELASVNDLNALLGEITGSTMLLDKLLKQEPKDFYDELVRSDDPNFIKLRYTIDNYLRLHSSRRPNELKLESPSFFSDGASLLQLLKRYHEKRLKQSHNKEPITKLKAGPLGNVLLKILTVLVTSAIRDRERFRYQRGQIYNIAREHFLSIGKQFQEQAILEDPKDIFYLYKDEIIRLINNQEAQLSYINIVKERKGIFENFAKHDLPYRFRLFGLGPKQKLIPDDIVDGLKLQGLATSPGIVRAQALVLHEFRPDVDFKDKILITYQTDPGWSIVFPLLKGVALEKGNTLSHAAILCRELNLPSVVKIPNLLQSIQNGDEIELNGFTGVITIIK